MAVTTAFLGLIVRSQVTPVAKSPTGTVTPAPAVTTGAGVTPTLLPPGSLNV